MTAIPLMSMRCIEIMWISSVPCRTALTRDRRLPSSVFGPVLRSALRLLASNCRNEVIGYCRQRTAPRVNSHWMEPLPRFDPRSLRQSLDLAACDR